MSLIFVEHSICMWKGHFRDFPGDQWLIFHTSTLGGAGLTAGWRTKTPHAAQCGPKTRRRSKCHLLAQPRVGMITAQCRGGSILWVQTEVSSRPEAFPAHARYPGIITNCTSFTSKCPGLDSHVFATALLNLISSPCAYHFIWFPEVLCIHIFQGIWIEHGPHVVCTVWPPDSFLDSFQKLEDPGDCELQKEGHSG